jgi:energy-coupling factor transport system ATP-binding protein
MVDISGLSFKYPRSHDNSINNLSLNIARGEKILIAGRNGAGKTTLSKILSGLIPHVEQGELTGDYFYNGKDIRKCAHLDVIRDTAILLQDFESQIVSTTVREELVFYPMNLGVSYADALARAEKICLKFGLADMMEREINSLSGGEKQKIALLSLLSAEPKTLILDEPFTDIDPSSQKFFLDFLKSGFEGTVIAFEQTVDYYEYFDSVAVLDNGIVIKKGGKELAGDIATLEQAGIEAPEVFRIIGGFVDASAFAADNVRQNFVFDETSYGALDMPGIAGDELIRAEGITHKYPDSGTNAVDGVDIVLHRGDFRVVLGGNGSGKTTLMKILCGILPLKCKNGSKPVCSAGYVYQNPDNQIFA